MEFESLRAISYNVNSGMDYVSKGSTNAASEKVDLQQTPKTGILSEKGKDPKSAETIKNELTELKDTISNEFFDRFVQEANKKLFTTGRQFSYTLHEATNRVAIKIIDSKTKDVIREVPPEKALDAAAKMLELVGVMFDEKV